MTTKTNTWKNKQPCGFLKIPCLRQGLPQVVCQTNSWSRHKTQDKTQDTSVVHRGEHSGLHAVCLTLLTSPGVLVCPLWALHREILPLERIFYMDWTNIRHTISTVINVYQETTTMQPNPLFPQCKKPQHVPSRGKRASENSIHSPEFIPVIIVIMVATIKKHA